MQTMMPLRVVAILSNVAFIKYSSIEGLLPVLILHSALLPLNILRTYQLRRMIEQTRAAAQGELSLESLLPHMTRARYRAGRGAVPQRRRLEGDVLHQQRRYRLEELGLTIGRGETLGEMSIFSVDRKRTATALCETDCELLRMSNEKVLELYSQNPRFGFPLCV